MKSKFLLGLIFLSFTTACDNGPQTKYQLRDTWGVDGNWDKSGKVASNSEAAVKKAPAKKAPVKVAAKTVIPVEKKVETPKNNTSTTSAKVNQENDNTETETPVKTVSNNAPKWEKKSSTASSAYYVKTIGDENLGFSYSVINNANVDAKFKTDYKQKLAKSLKAVQILADKETVVQGKKAWELDYVLENQGEKIQQRQVFINHGKNVMIANFTATETGFSTVEPEFKEITNHLKL